MPLPPNKKVSDGSQLPQALNLSLSEIGGSHLLHRLLHTTLAPCQCVIGHRPNIPNVGPIGLNAAQPKCKKLIRIGIVSNSLVVAVPSREEHVKNPGMSDGGKLPVMDLRPRQTADQPPTYQSAHSGQKTTPSVCISHPLVETKASTAAIALVTVNVGAWHLVSIDAKCRMHNPCLRIIGIFIISSTFVMPISVLIRW